MRSSPLPLVPPSPYELFFTRAFVLITPHLLVCNPSYLPPNPHLLVSMFLDQVVDVSVLCCKEHLLLRRQAGLVALSQFNLLSLQSEGKTEIKISASDIHTPPVNLFCSDHTPLLLECFGLCHSVLELPQLRL